MNPDRICPLCGDTKNPETEACNLCLGMDDDDPE